MNLPQQLHPLGVLSWLTMIGDTHNRLSSASFLQQLKPLLQTRSMEIFLRKEKPLAWVAWRQLSPEDWAEKLVSLERPVDDLKWVRHSLWLDFWVRPFGCDAELAQTLQRFFKSRHLTPEGVSWYDPSVNEGAGQLHLNVPFEAMKGL
jgi:hemolysin-activating ACP:hemolysin acyltransferase